MDIPEKTDQLNQGSSSSLTNKRKRGRPRRDESQTQQPANTLVTTVDENLIGQVVSGVVEGSFEAGYFLNVKVADTEKQLKGVVFLPERVTPVTPTTDLFPQAKMYARKLIPVPSLDQQTLPQQKNDIGFEPQTDNLIADKNQSANHPVRDDGVVCEAIDETNDPMDTEVKDVGGSSPEEKHTEPEGQTLSLMPQFASGDASKEDHTVLGSEACAASKTAVTVTPNSTKHPICEDSTNLIDLFPASETSQKQAMGCSSNLSLELFQNETKRPGTEEEKSLPVSEPQQPHGLDLMMEEKPASPIDNVPEELQLELATRK